MIFKKYYLFFAVIGVAFTSCSEDSTDPMIQLNGAPAIIEPTPNTEYILSEATEDDVAGRIEFTPADFGVNAPIQYFVQLDDVGNDFQNPSQLGNPLLETIDESYTQLEFNNVLNTREVPVGVPTTMELRVCASLGPNGTQQCSEAVPIVVTPYQAAIQYPFLTVPGSYQGWAPESLDHRIFSRESNDVYTGFLFVEEADAMHKYAQGLSWDTNWGDNDDDGTLELEGADIPFPDGGTGLYYFTVNLNNLTHSRELTTWGVLGNATPTGDSEDTDLEWDGEKLSITMDLTAGELRFRANDLDELVLGDDGDDSILDFNGASISVPTDGNYTINLFLTQSDYGYELILN